MASISTLRSWSAVAGRSLATVAVAAAATLTLAGPAGAHTPVVKADCKDGKTTLKVELTNYSPEKDNTVKVADGDTVLVDTKFGKEFRKKWELPGDVDHKFTVVVKAWNDPDGKKGFSVTKTLDVEACVEPSEPPTSTSPPTSSSSSEAPPETPETTTTTPIPANTTELAATGASIGIPLAIGAVLLIGGGALVFMVRRRGKA